MEMKQNNIAKQVYTLFGLVLFAFVNVFLFDDKAGIGFSVFSTLILLTIGLLSNRKSMRILGIVSYIINVIAAKLGLSYLGWLTAVQAIELIFVVWYLYPKDTFFKNDSTDRHTYKFRWVQILKIAGITIGAYILYNIVNGLWEGSFLEFGGKTAFIFGIQYFLYTFLLKARSIEDEEVEKYKHRYEYNHQLKANIAHQTEKKQGEFKTASAFFNKGLFVKYAGVWLIVMDLSILSYLFKPNDVGFGVGAFFVLLSIVVSLFVKTNEDSSDVFSVIYHKIRPVQPVFFIILLIAHANKFSYGAAYALLFAAVYFVWAINKINMKTLLTLTILIYFMPILGYISNPFRLGASNLKEAYKMVIDRGEVNYYYFGEYSFSLFSDAMDDDGDIYQYDDDYTSVEILEKDQTINIGKKYKGEYDLEVTYDYDSKAIELLGNGYDYDYPGDTIYLEEMIDSYEKVKANDFKYNGSVDFYEDYYYATSINGNKNFYYVYLEINEEWLEDYKANPEKTPVTIIIADYTMSTEEVYEETH